MFEIKIVKEKKLDPIDKEDVRIDEAINTIYPEYIGYHFFMNFGDGMKIRLSLKGELSEIYNDIIKLLASLKRNEESLTISFLSSGFTAIWYFTISNGQLEIEPYYTTAIIYKEGKRIGQPNYEEFKKIIKTGKTAFISEWEKLLIEVREDLKRAGYGNELEGFDYLESLPSINPEV